MPAKRMAFALEGKLGKVGKQRKRLNNVRIHVTKITRSKKLPAVNPKNTCWVHQAVVFFLILFCYTHIIYDDAYQLGSPM